MKLFHLSSALAKKEITGLCIKCDCLAFGPSVAHSEQEINLAFFLTQKSMANKTNLAKTFALEMLLWLCSEHEIKKALEKSDFLPEDFILACFSDIDPIQVFRSNKKPLGLKKFATQLELEKISLSRI